MQITFHSDSDNLKCDKEITEYEEIWREDGERIVSVWQKVTGLTFKESHINAVVFDGISHSCPLSLRYNLDIDRKKSTLIHELGHRLLHRQLNQREHSSLENHKTLFLVLYEVFYKLYGQGFADESVEWDKKLPGDIYRKAWEFALSLSSEERKAEFQRRLR